MQLQFYLGRAGTGKTQRCLDDIVERLRENPSPQAPPLIWLLPEQATAQAEAALLRQPGLRGIMRARVFSFKRLAREVLVETGGAATGFLGDLGRQMLLRALAVRHRGELKIFGRSVKDTGFIARLAAAFGELARFRHSFEELDALRKRLEETQRGGSLLARKLHDLVLLGRAYEAALVGRAANPDHFLDELSRRLERSRLVRGAEVWIDGFASLMPQELRAVEAILRQAANVCVTLLLDSAEIHSLPVSWRDTEPTRLFAQTEETYQRLQGMALDIGAELSEPIFFPASNQPTRFSDHPGLDGLEKRLVDSGMTPRMGNFREALLSAGEPLSTLPAELPSALLVEAPNRRAEVESIARAIRRLAREEGYRWRDIAVVARDLEPYDSLIRSTFARYGIPCFFDRRRALTHHPLVELLRSSIRAVASDWAIEDVTHYLKTDFAPATRHEVDLLENDALKRGVRGRRWWLKESPDEKHTALNAIRRRALAPLNTLHQHLTSTPWGAAPHPAGGRITPTPLTFN
ncbi:TPA: helicase-exonuclease AddAB subunit AddB, partial [Candidatus Sumerlaeota bacterium]|nr:helicase-exonuclease AddAB subunit AddB [Candidatus Sumerlaeota bacterium]